MKTIGQVLKDKGKHIWSTKPSIFVFDALEEMAKRNIGALLVMEGDNVVGVFSERDYARKVILKGKSSKTTTVKDIMSSPVIFITPDKVCEEGLALMTAKHIRHLPVFDAGKLVGVVSMGDLVHAIIAEQRVVIDRLEKYILDNLSIT